MEMTLQRHSLRVCQKKKHFLYPLGGVMSGSRTCQNAAEKLKQLYTSWKSKPTSLITIPPELQQIQQNIYVYLIVKFKFELENAT